VENNPDEVELLVRELRRANFDPEWKLVTTEGDYLAYLDPVPDVILSDCFMTVLPGLRATPRFTTTPIIALTALAMPGDRQRCLEAGANEYDLLLTEIRLPGNEELELVWSAYRSAPGMPVIIYTRHPSLGSAIHSIQLSVTAYLVKPVEFNVLLHYVKEGIANHHGFKLHGSEHDMSQIDQLTSAIQETIDALQATRRSFKSRQLAALRRKLERLIAGQRPELDDGRRPDL
jgi:CheY-like chemotaxis protein